MTKEAYYDRRGETYEKDCPETLLRCKKALSWMSLKDRPSIIEVGCKFGELYRLLQGTGEQYLYKAVDIDQRTLQGIPGYNKEQFICKNVNNGLPFPDESADYIVCLEVMEHLENATFFLEEVKRVLRCDGKLVLSVPNVYCWLEIFNNLRKYGDTEGHIASYSYQNIDALMNFVGLKISEQSGTNMRFPLAARLRGRKLIWKTNMMFLTRNYMFLIGK